MSEAGASDRASLFATATRALTANEKHRASIPVLLLDVPFESDAEARFLWTLVDKSPKALVTVPSGDVRTVEHLEKRGMAVRHSIRTATRISSRLSRHLFSAEPPSERERSGAAGMVFRAG